MASSADPPTTTQPPKVDLGDWAAVKRALDDAAAAAVLARGYAEDGTVYWAKLGLGLASCAVALLAQFYPGKPPATTPLLVACVTTYALLSVALTWLAARVEKDAFLFTRATARTPSLAISSKMDRFGADYKLSIEARGGGGGGGPAAAATLAAPDFLRADGVLLAPALARRVGDMLDRVEAAAKKKA